MRASSPSKNARAISTYSVIITFAGMSFLCKSSNVEPRKIARKVLSMRWTGHPFKQRTIDHRINLQLMLGHALYDQFEIALVRGQIFIAFNFLSHIKGHELRQGMVQRCPPHIHLVKRLHSRKPRGTPAGLLFWERCWVYCLWMILNCSSTLPGSGNGDYHAHTHARLLNACAYQTIAHNATKKV